jgi:hypothetical protein
MSEQDRIEAAAEAIYNTSSYSDQNKMWTWQEFAHRYPGDAFVKRAYAEAAVKAGLPDRAEFTRLTNAWEQAILARHHDPCELWQGECQQILADLEILVFGEEIDAA